VSNSFTYGRLVVRSDVFNLNPHRKLVGKTSVIRQSSEALPHEMTELKMALTMRLFVLLYTKYIAAEHKPAENVANTASKRKKWLNYIVR
jgi:hypothetical protein